MKKALALALAAVCAAATLSSCGTKKVDGLFIGGIGPTTGGAASYGQGVKNGAQLAIDEINANGGVNGMKLYFDFQDDEHDAEKAVNAYNNLKDKGMQILMGTVTSAPCVAVAEKTHADNMFQLTPSGSAVECTQNKDNVFRICFNDPNQGGASAKYLGQNGLATKVAVIYDSSDVYSSGIYENFAAECKNQNIEIVAAEAFTKDSNNDFTVQLQKIQSAQPELIFLPIYYKEAALVLTQANTAGMTIPFFGCDGLDGIIGQLGEDKALAEGVMLLTPFAADAKDEATQKFTAAYKAAYNNETPNQFAADAYDAIYTIKAALEKAGVNDYNISASELCDELKAVMTQITVPGVTGTMTWTADGEPTKDPKAMKIQDGVYTAM